MNKEWKDTSSYSRNDKIKEPKQYSLIFDRTFVVCLHDMHYDTDNFYITCGTLAYKANLLCPKIEGWDKAKELAVKLCRERLEKYLEYLKD